MHLPVSAIKSPPCLVSGHKPLQTSTITRDTILKRCTTCKCNVMFVCITLSTQTKTNHSLSVALQTEPKHSKHADLLLSCLLGLAPFLPGLEGENCYGAKRGNIHLEYSSSSVVNRNTPTRTTSPNEGWPLQNNRVHQAKPIYTGLYILLPNDEVAVHPRKR